MFCVAVLRAAYVGFLPAHSTDKDVKYRRLGILMAWHA